MFCNISFYIQGLFEENNQYSRSKNQFTLQKNSKIHLLSGFHRESFNKVQKFHQQKK